MLVLSDGPDRTGNLSTASLDDTSGNRFGGFAERAVPNARTGPSSSEWVQIIGAAGNNLHNGGVHAMPPVSQLDDLLGSDGRAKRAVDWLASVRSPASLTVDAPDSACADVSGDALTNLSAVYAHGPGGCLPLRRYAYCATEGGACSLESNVASSVSPFILGPMSADLRKTTMYTDLLNLSHGAAARPTVRHSTRAMRILVDDSGTKARGVLLEDGTVACACTVIAAGGVWGTAEVLMASLGLLKLGGLWEHGTLPIFDYAIFGPPGALDSTCSFPLRSGNLHTPAPTYAQAEFTICDSPSGGPPRLLAAWVLVMEASARGEVLLDRAGGGRVRGNHSYFEGQPTLATDAIDAVVTELRTRFGANLIVPAWSGLIVPSHHLGGGVAGAAAQGRVTGLSNVYTGDMSSYGSMVHGYTTAAAAVSGIVAAMRATEEQDGNTCCRPMSGQDLTCAIPATEIGKHCSCRFMWQPNCQHPSGVRLDCVSAS